MNFTVNIGDQLNELGQELARKAADHHEEANKLFDETKRMLSMAGRIGMLNEAYAAIFNAGSGVQSRKAIWYRRQKRLFKQLIAAGIDFSDMDWLEAQEAVKQHHQKSKSRTQRRKDSLRMLERAAKGAITKAQPETILETLRGALVS